MNDSKVRKYNFVCCLYGYKTWSLTLAEEYRLLVFDKRVQRRLFGPKKCEITGNGKVGALENFMNCTYIQEE
jgi:hypothetical protein